MKSEHHKNRLDGKHWPTPSRGMSSKGQYEIVDPGAYTEAVLHHQRSDFPKPVIKTKNDLRKSSIYYH